MLELACSEYLALALGVPVDREGSDGYEWGKPHPDVVSGRRLI